MRTGTVAPTSGDHNLLSDDADWSLGRAVGSFGAPTAGGEVTLICGATKPHPVLMGDLLVTGGPRRRLGFLPSLGALSGFPKELRQLPLHSLVQKVALLTPTVAMAWSGRLVVARRLFTDLREYLATCNGAPSAQSILEHLHALDYDDWKQLSLLGLVAQHSGSSALFWHNVEHRRYATHGDVAAGGTGSRPLLSYLDKAEHDSLPYELPMLNAGMQAYTGEFFTHDGLAEGFGGGYQLVYPDGGQLQRVEDLLYIIWFLGSREHMIKTASDKAIHGRAGPIIIKNFYVNDLLISLRSRLNKNIFRGKALGIGRAEFSAIVAEPPFVGGDQGIVTFHPDDMNRTNVVCSVFVFQEVERPLLLMIIDRYSNEDHLLTAHVDLKKRTITLRYQSTYWERVVEAVTKGPAFSASWW